MTADQDSESEALIGQVGDEKASTTPSGRTRGHLMPDKLPRIRRAGLSSGLGVAGMAIVGVGVGTLVVFAMVGLLFNSDMNADGVFWVVSVLMLGVAVALWLTHNRYWRGLAVGLSGFWVILVWLVVTERDGMSPEDMAKERASILAGDKPAYYLGEEAEGHDLEWVYPDGGDGAEGFSFGYGTNCGGEDSYCESDIDVSTFSLSFDYLDEFSCRRLEDSVLGVPAVVQDYRLVLFTGRSMIIIYELDTHDDHHGELALARKLRPLGQSEAVTDLPPPTPTILELVDKTCEPAGQH